MVKDKSESKVIDIRSIMTRFTDNIKELRVFNEEIGKLAEDYDLAAFKDYFRVIASALGVPEPKSEDLEKIRNEWKGISRRLDNTRSEEDKKIIAKFLNQKSDIAEKLVDAFVQIHHKSPTQGKLVRRGALVVLISYFESLISDIIQAYYLRYPEALPSDQKLLSLHELRKIGSVEDAEYYIIMKEIETVLRESLEQQFLYISNKMHFNSEYLDEYKNKLIEINQRRNIIVHNGSIVNQLYLRNVDKDLSNQYSVELGNKIDVNKEYLSEAIDIVFVCGFVLLQQCLRKWDKLSEEADVIICNYGYRCLLEKRNNLVVYISQFANKIKISADDNRRVIATNYAIALKELGEYEKVEIILSKFDWSACASRFLVAFHILKGEHEEFFQLLPRAIAGGEIERHDLEEWPLYKEFRGTTRFQAIIDSCTLPLCEQEEPNSRESS